MKAVMISINPKWCELIVNGQKTIEVRKTRPKIDTPFKGYIYMTQGTYKDLGTYCDWIYENRMKVIGEFMCDKVYNLINAFGGIMFADENLNQLEPQLFRDMSCLTDEQTADYLGNKDGYGWHISDLKIYDKPKELNKFTKYMDCKNTYDCCACHNWDRLNLKCIAMNNEVKRPPQSWCYIEEL